MKIHNENNITFHFLGVVYLASLGILVFQHFADISLGAISFFAWIVFIFGSLAFVWRFFN